MPARLASLVALLLLALLTACARAQAPIPTVPSFDPEWTPMRDPSSWFRPSWRGPSSRDETLAMPTLDTRSAVPSASATPTFGPLGALAVRPGNTDEARSNGSSPALSTDEARSNGSSPLLPTDRAPQATCTMDLTHSLPPGFYAADAWPKGQVVLTFDDGPHPTITPRVLDLLAEHQLPATFFVVGVAIRTDTYRLIQRMVAEGHTIGSHTYNHDIGMARRTGGRRAIEYIRGQHELTQILIELALLAESDADFEALFRRVIDDTPNRYLPSAKVRSDWPEYVARHRALLEERGLADDRPYRIVYSRPPGGIPYLRQSEPWSRDVMDTVLRDLGWLNVMWHAGSGDTDPDRRQDFAFLTHNLRRASRQGGVLLIHDYIRRDALKVALDRMVADNAIEVVPLETGLQRKYGCSGARWASATGKRASTSEMFAL